MPVRTCDRTKFSIHQQLRSCDKEARKRYCAWFLRKCDASAQFKENIWFSDEAHFHLNGCVSGQNYHYWNTKPPIDEVAERPLRSMHKRPFGYQSAEGRHCVGAVWMEHGDGQTVSADCQCGVLQQRSELLAGRRCMPSSPPCLTKTWCQDLLPANG